MNPWASILLFAFSLRGSLADLPLKENPRIGVGRVEKLLRVECVEKIVPVPKKWHCLVDEKENGVTCDPGSYVFTMKKGSTVARCIELHIVHGERGDAGNITASPSGTVSVAPAEEQ